MISVHAMSSCPMGVEVDSIVDTSGRLNGNKNIIVSDASVLPTNIGESPQGTIMAMSHEILSRNLH
jgi:choline dehydrogenase-like flavoprotein